ncbi:MAG: NAD(P)H-hydrate dehydratase, partial [Betaproteobacteria bacterium]|nr:NAD(P)H-hydrate dehydratase [Betaproteobacteria bacterium]
IVGGARGMEGAVSLAVKGCLAIGVGKCFVLPLEARSSFHTWPAQVMRCSPAGFAAVLAHPQRQVIAIGCGLGAGARAIKYLRDALSSTLDLVIDADGLNLLASAPELMEQLRLSLSASSQSAASAEAIGLEHRRRVVLTPHPLEAARLLGVSRDAVENDRFAAIDALVSRSGCTVILKGAGSLVQSPLMQSLIIDCAAPALAQAGSGDFLCGMVAALLARHRGVEPQVLAAAAAWLHADGAARWSQSKRQSHALSFDALSEWISDSFAQLT